MSSFENLKDVTEFTLCVKPLSTLPPTLDEYFSTMAPQVCIEMLRRTDFSAKREVYEHQQQTHLDSTALRVEIRSKEAPNARYKETFELKKIALHFAGLDMVFPFKS